MKLFVALLLLSTLSIPIGVNAIAPPVQVQQRALFLSSLNATRPMGYYAGDIVSSLSHAGYNVTSLADTAVTISVLLTTMKNYSVVIWRTDSFTQKNETYWYVGEKPSYASEQKYASDFAAGRITTSTGMVAVNTEFFTDHFGPDTLQSVKLLVIVSSNSNVLAPVFLAAGITSVVFCSGAITLQFGLVDDLTAALVGFLAHGESVYHAVSDTISPFTQGENLNDPLDSTFGIIFWYLGDGTTTIAPTIHSTPSIRLPRLP
jgi:hypothetical protein